jgi:hypothetical protein
MRHPHVLLDFANLVGRCKEGAQVALPPIRRPLFRPPPRARPARVLYGSVCDVVVTRVAVDHDRILGTEDVGAEAGNEHYDILFAEWQAMRGRRQHGTLRYDALARAAQKQHVLVPVCVKGHAAFVLQNPAGSLVDMNAIEVPCEGGCEERGAAPLRPSHQDVPETSPVDAVPRHGKLIGGKRLCKKPLVAERS